jgi:hypothetical protein
VIQGEHGPTLITAPNHSYTPATEHPTYGNATGGKDDEETETETEPAAEKEHNKVKMMDKIKGTAKIVQGKINSDISKVEEGKRIRNGST